MGFEHLRLIDPCSHLNDEAMMMAHGSHDILHSAGVYDDFESAVTDLDLIICTTAKERSAKHDYHSSREIRSYLENKTNHLANVGILFGNEESGLPNHLVLKSDMAMSIPMAGGYPSLNLAQAVMIAAYELSPLNLLEKPGTPLSKSGEGWETLKTESTELLTHAGIPKGSPLFHRIMERMATVGANDIPLFLSVLSRIQKDQAP
jgi:tRNA/rRNA methyltransferase